jgi:hypothetical protein
MKLFPTLLLATLCAATGYGQTLKSVMIDTNGVQVNQFGSGSASNTAIKLGGTNWGFWQATGPDRILLSIGGATGATFTSNSITTTTFSGNLSGGVTIGAGQSISFGGGANVSGTRTNLNLGATWLTNTNVTNFRTAIGLGATNTPTFDAVFASGYFEVGSDSNTVSIDQDIGIQFGTPNLAATTRTNLGLGATNSVHFASLLLGTELTINGNSGIIQWNSNNYIDVESGILGSGTNSNLGWSGDEITVGKSAKFADNIVITNQTAANKGLLFIYRTNNEPFLGLANLIASNNTTISNETLFRVGTAEATNRSAQFGFRSTNTNGNGVAVFSVFGYNALMMVGADASTNAVIYSGGGTNNQVMTLIKSGATEFARPISFANATDAATTRTNVGLPLAALTNTSNVTTMRALAGSTNTNHPFSGSFNVMDDNSITFTIQVSNGIIISATEF